MCPVTLSNRFPGPVKGITLIRGCMFVHIDSVLTSPVILGTSRTDEQAVSTPFVFKQFRYVMNGHYTGELFLSDKGDCQFRSARTGKLTERHGRWYYCNFIQAIKAYFDFEGKAKQAQYKWTFFRGTEGIDYEGRQIKVIPNAEWVSTPDGTGCIRCPIKFVEENAPCYEIPGKAPVLQFILPYHRH